MQHHTFASVKGYAVTEYLKRSYPDLPLIEVANIEQGIQMLRENEVFGYIDSALAVGFTIQQSGSLDIKVSGQLNFSSTPSIAIRNDLPQLTQLFDKALLSISKEERQAIYNNWVSVRFEQGFDYRTLFQFLSIAFVIVVVTLYWNRRLVKANRKTQHALIQLREAQALLEDKNAKLEQLATVDMLTGLQNRFKIEESLDIEINRFERFNSAFSVVLLDLDDFKLVNDNYGHQVGDKVLIEFANILKQHTRSVDKVGRWGGEEFIIICPETDLIGAEKLANKIRFEIEQHQFAEIGHKTSSLGVSTIRIEDSKEVLVSRADKALYAAKTKGKNLVEVN